jgi:hypothetical protein
MTARERGIFPAWPLTVVIAVTILATVMVRPANAAPVEYVRICPLYGAGFLYFPGSDVCVDFATNDAREQTSYGTWSWRLPNNPRTWAQSPQDACQDGSLVKFGDITSSDLTLNLHGRYETTTHYQLRLRQGQYIASVLYQGGFTGDGVTGDAFGAGNFCMYYYYNDPTYGPNYTPFGCIDTAPRATVPATLAFSPDNPIPPPSNGNKVYVLGANGNLWGAASTADIQGELSIWLCLQSAHGSGPFGPN